MLTGKFDYHIKGCATPHHIPQGESRDGYPVIVLLRHASEATIGKTYSFGIMMTRDAVYVIDNITYRVGYATSILPVSDSEGDAFDVLVHAPQKPKPAKLAEGLRPDVLDRLQALKARLVA